jgi:hypothetical protein
MNGDVLGRLASTSVSARSGSTATQTTGAKGLCERIRLTCCAAPSKVSVDLDTSTFVESAEESTTMLALEVDPRVVGIDPQPFTVRLDLSRVFATRSEAARDEPRARPAPVDAEAPQESVRSSARFPDLV